MIKRTGIHWFSKDLRVQDNASLSAIAGQVDELICVYLHDQASSEPNTNELAKSEIIGEHRRNFIHQSLQQLDQSLAALGQRLIVVSMSAGSAVEEIVRLIKDNNATHLSAEWHCGFNEQATWKQTQSAVSQLKPNVQVIQKNTSTLYQTEQFPFSIHNMPATFSPFRKKVEKYCEPEQTTQELVSLPRPPEDIIADALIAPADIKTNANYYPQLAGGDSSAQQQLDYYLFGSDCVATYKQTRNGLDGWDFSSKLSAWLAQGCISPRQVFAQLCRYESERVKNDSTYWLFFELLWREFFHWHHAVNGNRLFAATGVQRIHRDTKHNSDILQQWQQGETGYPIVDALMRQLLATGFMSNRGRQLVASCLVHELGQDWRYGAKYFEYQLIDFDVASNWGNWQYLGGVGADPRGHRQFNLQKQTETYDPKGAFIKHWLDQ